MSLLIRVASNQDLRGIVSLLTSFGLPAAGVADNLTDFLVAEDAGDIVASAGTEAYGSCVLLRSVAVRHVYQGRGVAHELVQQLLDRARRNGVHRAYLLTTTAASYFQRLGFVPLPRDQVDHAVQASLEFRELCSDTAIAMTQTLRAKTRGGGNHA